jgi:hypothetical protein
MGNRVKVAILGASPKPDRYAYKAREMLLAHGHEVTGVSPSLPEIGSPVTATVGELPEGIDTLTVYVGAKASSEAAGQILSYGFRRAVFNPGAENPALMRELRERGVDAFEACTLVMLSTGQF